MAAASGWSLALLLIWLHLPVYMLHQYEEHDGDRFRRVPIATLLGVDGEVAVVLAPALRPGVEVAVRGTAALKAMLPAADGGE